MVQTDIIEIYQYYNRKTNNFGLTFDMCQGHAKYLKVPPDCDLISLGFSEEGATCQHCDTQPDTPCVRCIKAKAGVSLDCRGVWDSEHKICFSFVRRFVKNQQAFLFAKGEK